jgi:hypothetical protein
MVRSEDGSLADADADMLVIEERDNLLSIVQHTERKAERVRIIELKKMMNTSSSGRTSIAVL